jgi:hypothetical protein
MRSADLRPVRVHGFGLMMFRVRTEADLSNRYPSIDDLELARLGL